MSPKPLFGFDVIEDVDIPKGMIFIIPPDVKAALELAKAADAMKRHGIISEGLRGNIWKLATDAAVKAARERRVGVITNLGD